MRSHITFAARSALLLAMLSACGRTGPASPNETEAIPQPALATSTTLRPVTTPTSFPTSSDTPLPSGFPLSEPGPYHVGMRTIKLVDDSRAGRQVSVTVWYPASRPADQASTAPTRDAKPDPDGAPYPLLLSSTKLARTLAPYLVSHGFAWASVDAIDVYFAFYEGAIDQPLDILFALDQVATNPPEDLEGMVDADRAGTIGYSFDGFNSLAMSGARIDPQYYRSQCPTPDAPTEAVLGALSAFGCGPAGKWNEFSAHFDTSITASEDGLWQPITDPRIRAVMPMACEGWWLFGERGLAAVDRPVLMLDATDDELYKENSLIYEHLGSPDKALITFVGPDHMMIFDAEMVARMAHFAVAFFGVHLQGRQDLARYFSEEFVAQHDDLFWGVYPGE